MNAHPTSATIRSPGWIGALLAILGVLGFVYYPLLRYSFEQWLKPDYSHGFLVPLFSVYLAWKWKRWAPTEIAWPDPLGLAFIAGGEAFGGAEAVEVVALNAQVFAGRRKYSTERIDSVRIRKFEYRLETDADVVLKLKRPIPEYGLSAGPLFLEAKCIWVPEKCRVPSR